MVKLASSRHFLIARIFFQGEKINCCDRQQGGSVQYCGANMKKTGSFDEKDLKKRLECDPKKLLKNEVLMQDMHWYFRKTISGTFLQPY